MSMYAIHEETQAIARAIVRGDLTDLADYVQRKALRISESADLATRPARTAIKAIKVPSEREICGLIACLTKVIAESGWSHTDAAITAMESLTDAHAVLEAEAEKHE